MGLVSELRRRNVFRAAIAYLVIAWLILQVGDTLAPSLHLDEWVNSALAFFLILGFPIAVFFAWAYELTPNGIKLEKHVDRDHSITHLTGRKLDYLIIAVLTLALVVFAFDKFVLDPTRDAESVQSTGDAVSGQVTESGVATTPDNSIAVLPFVSLSSDPEQEYFSDGISEELLNLLAHVDGLRVASRTSSFAFRGENENLKEIAEVLNVSYLLEGSVRKADDRVRITAQLVDARTDRHLWSDSFDRSFVDIFSIQEEIANAIVSALVDEVNFPEPLERVTVVAVTRNLDAYELYLQARQLFIGRRRLDESIMLFERAIELDAEFALAWEGLAAVEYVGIQWLRNDGVDHVSHAKSAAQRALELNPQASMPYAVLGTPFLNVDPTTGRADMVQGFENLSTALANDPKNATAWLWRGTNLLRLGFFEEGASDFTQCLNIDPAYKHCRTYLAAAEIFQGHDAHGLALLRENLNANFSTNEFLFIPALVRSGDRFGAWYAQTRIFGENTAAYLNTHPATEVINAIENPDEDHSASETKLRQWSLTHDIDPDLNFPCEIALLGGYDTMDQDNARDSWVFTTRCYWDPSYARFRGTSGFKLMARFAGLPDYWRARGFPPSCRPIGDVDFECD